MAVSPILTRVDLTQIWRWVMVTVMCFNQRGKQLPLHTSLNLWNTHFKIYTDRDSPFTAVYASFCSPSTQHFSVCCSVFLGWKKHHHTAFFPFRPSYGSAAVVDGCRSRDSNTLLCTFESSIFHGSAILTACLTVTAPVSRITGARANALNCHGPPPH